MPHLECSVSSMVYVGFFQNRHVIRMNRHVYILVQDECTAYTNWEVIRFYYYGTKYGAGLYEPSHSVHSSKIIKAVNELLLRRKK